MHDEAGRDTTLTKKTGPISPSWNVQPVFQNNQAHNHDSYTLKQVSTKANPTPERPHTNNTDEGDEGNHHQESRDDWNNNNIHKAITS